MVTEASLAERDAQAEEAAVSHVEYPASRAAVDKFDVVLPEVDDGADEGELFGRVAFRAPGHAAAAVGIGAARKRELAAVIKARRAGEEREEKPGLSGRNEVAAEPVEEPHRVVRVEKVEPRADDRLGGT